MTDLMIDHDLETIFICAVRYSIGRQTYMPELVCRYITSLLPALEDNTLNAFVRDIKPGLADPSMLGSEADQKTWINFLNAVLDELIDRERAKL